MWEKEGEFTEHMFSVDTLTLGCCRTSGMSFMCELKSQEMRSPGKGDVGCEEGQEQIPELPR